MQNRVDASLSTTTRDEIPDLIAQIRPKFPLLIDLSPEERRRLPGMGDKSRAFVQAALALAGQDVRFCRARSIKRKGGSMRRSYFWKLTPHFTR